MFNSTESLGAQMHEIQRADEADLLELILIYQEKYKVRKISAGIKLDYHEILTSVVDLMWQLSASSI